MGTNYYLYRDICPHCGRSDEPYHIGKSSAGWYFALHIDIQEGITNYNDILNLMEGNIIKDEYGREVTKEDMISIITEREWGDRGLLRSKIDGRHCVGHGEGSWDYIQGQFS